MKPKSCRPWRPNITLTTKKNKRKKKSHIAVWSPTRAYYNQHQVNVMQGPTRTIYNAPNTNHGHQIKDIIQPTKQHNFYSDNKIFSIRLV